MLKRIDTAERIETYRTSTIIIRCELLFREGVGARA